MYKKSSKRQQQQNHVCMRNWNFERIIALWMVELSNRSYFIRMTAISKRKFWIIHGKIVDSVELVEYRQTLSITIHIMIICWPNAFFTLWLHLTHTHASQQKKKQTTKICNDRLIWDVTIAFTKPLHKEKKNTKQLYTEPFSLSNIDFTKQVHFALIYVTIIHFD